MSALTALRAARLDLVGVLTLGMITAVGGGIIRDVIIASLPPATFRGAGTGVGTVLIVVTRGRDTD